ALSAAEKRDYAELSSFRQPFAAIFFAAVSAANLAAPTFRPTPQPLPVLPCSAALCCEGANSKRARRGWQGVFEILLRAAIGGPLKSANA
uniref:hypothetical protein n=1 Tax=Cupriavidus taiwanensis TaxID=164546 RepID=UPI001F120E48